MNIIDDPVSYFFFTFTVGSFYVTFVLCSQMTKINNFLLSDSSQHQQLTSDLFNYTKP